MTDRHAGYIVILSEDIREDDSEKVISALGLIKGVIGVEPVMSDYNLHIAERRIQSELGLKLLDVLYPQNKKD